MKNNQLNELHVYQLHKEYKKEMVQHQNKVFYDLKTILQVSINFDNKFYALYHPLPKYLMCLCDIFLCQLVVYAYIHSKKKFQFLIIELFNYFCRELNILILKFFTM